MKKGKIISISNFEKVYRYVIKKQKDIHGLFCNLFSDLKLSDDSIGDVDIIFDDLENEYIYIEESEKDIEIHLFITKDLINFIIKTNINQRELNGLIEEYFDFPK